ncbi:MAG: beta-xylosidase [Gluconacetobacter diazotrophicus]|nr:beta-xylosidase [Gluconacetobacter diazotrophicus]
MVDRDGIGGPTRRGLLKTSALSGLAAALAGSGVARAATGAAKAVPTAPFTPANAFFNAHHSPIGAYSTFTLGYPGASGGFGIEQKLPGKQSVFVGVLKNGVARVLPFFDTAAETGLTPYAPDEVKRDFRVSSDTFSTADLSFTLYSPVRSIPDPSGAPALPSFGHGPLLGVSTAGRHPIEEVLLPAVFAELVVDNTTGATAATAAFAVAGGNAQIQTTGYPGVVFGTDPFRTAIVTDDVGAQPFSAATLTQAVAGNYGSGPVGGIAVTVPAGRKQTIRFALCFHRAGNATTGRVTTYWYTRYYPDIAAVMLAAAQDLPNRIRSFTKDNKLVDNSALSDDQKFLLAQAIRSYYGNTALLSEGASTPWFVVLEGQYQYMNTFDLTVDQQFFELGMNPWTVKNELDNFAAHYSYQSGTEVGSATGAGGISFTHDQGQWPKFSPDGASNYERPDTRGTFSFMTGEQLTNWILIAGVYATQTGDVSWVARNASIFPQILESLANRDNPDPTQRDGVESYNSTRTATGYEITTYDSVGAGLEEAVGNTYLGGKCFSAYLILQGFLEITGQADLAAQAGQQAARFAATALAHVTAQGYITSNVYDGTSIAIIPVIEGLVYSYFGGRKDALKPNGPYGALIKALKKHLTTVLDTGLCITSDGGWKLDSQSDNTWLSKTFLNEFVGRQVLNLDIRASTDKADAASVSWLTNSTSGVFAFSDQIINQYAIGSEYYPRGVTAILWLQEPPA